MSAGDSSLLPETGQAPKSNFQDFGSLSIFWSLIEPILLHSQARRLCEIGVEKGRFSSLLIQWARENNGAYVGVDPVLQVSEIANLKSASDDVRLVAGHSLDVLPTLGRCDAYFLDGDHNYFTVRQELDLISDAAMRELGTASPIIFVHDVGWPWGRRDIYYAAGSVPAEARHPSSEILGVLPESDELVDRGMRSPGCYSIATSAGGLGNGVLTAVENFLASTAGQGWKSLIVPAAYGLAILYQPAIGRSPAACVRYLESLREAMTITGEVLKTFESHHLALLLWSEDVNAELQAERGRHFNTLNAYKDLENAYQTLLSDSRHSGSKVEIHPQLPE